MLRQTAKPFTSSVIQNLPDFIGEFVEHRNRVAPLVGEGGAGAGLAQRLRDGDRLRYCGVQRLERWFLEGTLVPYLFGRSLVLVDRAMPRDENMRQSSWRLQTGIRREVTGPEILAKRAQAVGRQEIRDCRDDHEISQPNTGFGDR